MKKTFLIFLSIFLSACGTQATPTIDAENIAQTAVSIASTSFAQTAEAMPTATKLPEPTIPSTPEVTATPVPPFDYVVTGQTETCPEIAIKFNVSMQSIIDLNGIETCRGGGLPEGKVLKIPYPTPTPDFLQ